MNVIYNVSGAMLGKSERNNNGKYVYNGLVPTSRNGRKVVKLTFTTRNAMLEYFKSNDMEEKEDD